MPVYPDPTWPSLSDGPCKIAVASSGGLCGGRADCPVVLDARLAGDAATSYLDLVGTPSGRGYVVFSGTYPSLASHCLFSIDRNGASTVAVSPFFLPPASAGQTYGAVALAADSSENPHAILGAGGQILHYQQGGAGWVSDALPVPSGLTEFTVAGVASSTTGIFVSVSDHPPDPGYYRSFKVQLFSGSGAGTWQSTPVFDGAGTQELLAPALGLDAMGAPVLIYDARLDLGGGGLGYATYLWRNGMTSALSTPTAALRGAILQTPGDATTADNAVRFDDDQGIHLVIPRAGAAPDSMLIPGTARVPLDGCPVGGFDRGSMPRTCQGHGGESCTLKGAALLLADGPRRTDDGTIWFAYAMQRIDEDVTLRDYSSGGPDANTYCFADLKADRTTTDLYIARLSPHAAMVDLRLRVPLGGAPQFNAASGVRLQTRGDQLFVAYRVGDSTASYRYLVLDATRL